MTVSLGKNIASLRAQRLLGTHRDSLGGAFERLSSGLRLNRASDDAASLAISMRLSQQRIVAARGARNINDGISALTIADSSLQQLVDVIARQRELATQASKAHSPPPSGKLSMRNSTRSRTKTREFWSQPASTAVNS